MKHLEIAGNKDKPRKKLLLENYGRRMMKMHRI